MFWKLAGQKSISFRVARTIIVALGHLLMAEADIATPLIQLIALFLPAWAVVIQVLTRLIRRTDFDDEPELFPFVALGLTLSVASLWVFTYAGHKILAYFVTEGVIEGSGPLAEALILLELGTLAFVGLGYMVVATVAYQNISNSNLVYILILILIFSGAMWGGWLFGGPVVILLLLTMLFILTWWVTPRIYECVGPVGPES